MSPSALKIHLKSIISQMLLKFMRYALHLQHFLFSSFLEDAHSIQYPVIVNVEFKGREFLIALFC
jgi:hypothetical protein